MELHDVFIVVLSICLTVLSGYLLLNHNNHCVGAFAPSDYLNKSDLFFYQDMVCINISNYTLSSYSGTGSMIPLMDQNANGIEIPITDPTQVHIGDLITYTKRDNPNELIIHRVLKIQQDNNGFYYIMKGDNNNYDDDIVRFEQIKYKTVVILY